MAAHLVEAAIPTAEPAAHRSNRATVAVPIAAGTLFVFLALAYAYYFVFSRPMSPDEGYLMITVQSFMGGHPLYDSVFTQYGPFYYFYEYVLHALGSVPLTHDATRMMCIAHWLGAAALFGIAAGRLLRSALAGIFVFAQTTVHLSRLADEPGHPQELVMVLIGLGVLAALRYGRRAGALEILAALAALLAFTKINVGIFFGFSLFLTMRCHSLDRFARGGWMWLLTCASAVIPVVLMRRHLNEEWCRNYSVVVSAAIVSTLLLSANCTDPRKLGGRDWRRVVATFAVVTFVLLSASLLAGTSWRGLLHGLLLTPLKMPGVALLAFSVPSAALLNAGASLALALCASYFRCDKRLQSALSWLKGAYAFSGCLWMLSDAAGQLAWLLPWSWLALVPVPAIQHRHPGENFFRTFLCIGATWQALQAYPIAGTQTATGTVLLVLLYALCLEDFLKTFASQVDLPARFARTLTPRTVQLSSVFGWVALLYFFANTWCELPKIKREYASLPALDLPGSRRVHMDRETTEMYRALSQFLRTECDTFVTYPGINSLYFWTEKQPPTHLNSTVWGQFSHAQQEHILRSLFKSPRPVLAVVAAAMDRWTADGPAQIAPLVRCVREDCRELTRIGRFIIFVPKENAAPARQG